jgi:glycolate oxidase iron-sulfur subunit
VPTSLSVFDSHHPPSEELIADCVHCGFCLPTCPTYALWGEEMDSPRGRVYLMKLGLEGGAGAAMSDEYVGHFDKCLGCMACLTSCPSGVQYDKLIEATRAQIERNHPRRPGDRLFRWLLFALFPHPGRLRLAAAPLWLYQRMGLQWLARRSGLLKLLPARLRSMEALAPRVTADAFRARMAEVIPAQGAPRGRVGLLVGCVQSVFFRQVNEATARVLAAEGFEVVIPPSQGCCGALMVHAGREGEATALARRTIDTFEAAGVDAIVINAAGCGSTMKEYGHLLRDDPAYAARAAALAAKCRDVSEVLAGVEPRAPRHPLPLRVAYHDACHLQHAQRVKLQPRQVLATVPGLEVLEVPEAAICCGSAGIYNLVEPEAAEQLGQRKAEHVLSTGARAVVSSNPGCLLQIRAALERARRPLPVFHMVELLDASMRNAPLPIPHE